jgi:putative SOS response-associated peptidase YedK
VVRHRWSCYTYNRDEARLKLRDKILVYGAVPRAHIRPTDLGPVIVPEHDGVACREMRWGWAVPWDKKPFINAKSETVSTLKTFQPHLDNRCLLLADGFFEKGVLFRQADSRLFCIAGLWREVLADGHRPRPTKADAEGKTRFCYTMLTTTPNESVAKYHHRMPFILKPEQFDLWLGEGWRQVLSAPDHAPLEKIQKQTELF